MSVQAIPEKSFRNLLLSLDHVLSRTTYETGEINTSTLASTFYACPEYAEAVAETIDDPRTAAGLKNQPRRLLRAFVWDLYRLNRVAYRVRYNEGLEPPSNDEVFSGPAEALTDGELVKLLECIDYNTAEAANACLSDRLEAARDVLNLLLGRFALCLVRSLDAYQSAPWNGDVDRTSPANVSPGSATASGEAIRMQFG